MGRIDASFPSWLDTPPVSQIAPPVNTRLQDLPFQDLAWEDFERLCLRLIRNEANVEHCQLYGDRGQDQSGIDIFARFHRVNKYRVYQCKRVQTFGPSHIREAVALFLEGDWASKCDTFVLCTTESLTEKRRADAIEIQRGVLQQRGIALILWDRHQIAIKLKGFPELVDDFFGRAWVEMFIGHEQANALGQRLDGRRLAEFRSRMAVFYHHVFITHDPGFPNNAASRLAAIPITDRYLLPDICEYREAATIEPVNALDDSSIDVEVYPGVIDMMGDRPRKYGRRSHSTTLYQQRQSAVEWLAIDTHNVILGGPGAGKSSLLRLIITDLLQETPRFQALAHRWGTFLPIWVPFALWTKMIDSTPLGACSLRDMLFGWFKSWGEERLWPLVEQALEDDRLLLIVDGLDEWTNEQAGQVAVQRLQVFVSQRNVPAIIATRPHGFQRLGLQTTGWRIGELAELSPDQQAELTRIWFRNWLKNQTPITDVVDVELERKVTLRTQAFMLELDRSRDLSVLAKIPLLLSLLIFLHLHTARLPQNRFRAYADLTEHLISTHPRRRLTAASLPMVDSELLDDDIKGVLAFLAFHMQLSHSEGVVGQAEAKRIIETYLTDDVMGLGFELHQGRRSSHHILELGEDKIGLLVRASPTELKYFHRSLQEYLAAFHLSQLPLKDQLGIVEANCTNPQWHEVFLALFAMTSRSEDIHTFVQRIQTKPVNGIERQIVELLLCEAACSDSNCSTELARQLVRNAFSAIEFGSWMPHRERLLRHVLSGLGSSKVREIVKAQLSKWFPNRVAWRDDLYNILAMWPKLQEVINVLYNGLHDEQSANKRAAAKAVATIAGGDIEIGNRIVTLANTTTDSAIRAAAIESLLSGWPHDERLDAMLDAAYQTVSPELQLIAIAGFIQFQRHNEDHLDTLLRFAPLLSRLDYAWRKDIPALLVQGWPKHSKLKDICLANTERQVRDSRHPRLDERDAIRILVRGFPGDTDVVRFLVSYFTSQDSRITLLDSDHWLWIRENFGGQGDLTAAINSVLKNRQISSPSSIAMAPLVGKTSVGKAWLIASLQKKEQGAVAGIQWLVWALLEGWGMQDVEVSDILLRVAYSDTATTSWIAHLLPDIIVDPAACRMRLLQILRDPECRWYSFLMSAFRRLNAGQRDPELIDTVLGLNLDRTDNVHKDLLAALIIDHPYADRVRQLAIQELSAPDGMYFAVAQSYGADEFIRSIILSNLTVLPANLREMIATFLTDATVDDSMAISFLERYDFELSGPVTTQASIGYHHRLKVSGGDIVEAANSLEKALVCNGFRYEERRQAAFAGLLVLDRMDILREARETFGEKGPAIIPLDTTIQPSMSLIRLVLEHWTQLEEELGSDFMGRLARTAYDQREVLDTLCIIADKYPRPKEMILKELENPASVPTPNMLAFLARIQPESDYLVDVCLRVIQNKEFTGLPESETVAGEILGAHFKGSSSVLTQLLGGLDTGNLTDGQVIALCEGWPDCQQLENYFQHVKETGRSMSYPLYLKLLLRKGSQEKILEVLDNLLESAPDIWSGHSKIFARSMMRRITTDDSLLAELTNRLWKSPTPSQKVTLPLLISGGRGLLPSLRNWIVEEHERQSQLNYLPEFGVDLTVGEIRAVMSTLVQVLSHNERRPLQIFTEVKTDSSQ